MTQDFCFLIYTNENYLPIAELSLSEFDKHYPNNELKKYLVSNKFSNSDYQFKSTTLIDCGIQFDGAGKHFAQTMIKALEMIEEKYIIFFCDDYLLIDKPNDVRLKKLLDIIVKNDIDIFSFASCLPKSDWKKSDIFFDDLPDRSFYYMPDNFQYLYGVQPCIWKKSSLQEILKYNPNLSLHDLDTSNVKNKEGFFRQFDYNTSKWKEYPQGSKSYGFKIICTDFKAYDELYNFEFFIFPYIEIIRHGFFNVSYETNTKNFLENFIKEKNLKENNNFEKFFL